MTPEYRQRMVLGGMVQGVGFRFFTCRVAEKYQVAGYVRNLPGGEVEVVAEGGRGEVESFMEEVSRGPSYSHVVGVKTYLEQPTGQYRAFGIRY
ncbi:MAG: acylphosphatase [Candidatus Glassbacteria bacterium]|nr:acylphosphatase [Candidatus Glassbacteria bacterium]